MGVRDMVLLAPKTFGLALIIIGFGLTMFAGAGLYISVTRTVDDRVLAFGFSCVLGGTGAGVIGAGVSLFNYHD
jgi:hypothetical protein